MIELFLSFFVYNRHQFNSCEMVEANDPDSSLKFHTERGSDKEWPRQLHTSEQL